MIENPVILTTPELTPVPLELVGLEDATDSYIRDHIGAYILDSDGARIIDDD